MGVTDINTERPIVGIPELNRREQSANLTEIRVALIDHVSRIALLESGDAGNGDMTKALYDPQSVNGDAFARANHTGTQALSTLDSGTANRLFGTDGSGDPIEVTLGANVSLSAGTLSSTGGGGGGGGGDMDAAVYDPQTIAGDAFARANHTGTVDPADLDATGTRDSTTFLRGDDTWAVPAGGGGDVDSVFGRTAAVVAQADDYAANQITFTPAGDIAATDVQAAIAELDTEKFDVSDGTLADGLTAITRSGLDSANDLLMVWDDSASTLKKLPWSELTDALIISASDETSDLTTGTAKVTFRTPWPCTVTDVRANVNTAPTGAALTVDINEAGVSILSTKLTIDAAEKTSTTAATPAVISDASLAEESEITIDIDQIGSTIAGKGLKVTLIVTRP